jgi:hypothetical protein
VTAPGTTNQFAAFEEESARALCAAGFDAFVCSSESTLKGGVSVRLGAHDQRIEWASNRSDVAPKGYFFSSYDHTFVLHAGRVTCVEDAARLQGFVAKLVERSVVAAFA